MRERNVALKVGAIGFGLLLAVAAHSAHAQESRWIKQTSATSNCIGEPVSPLCALDTYLACHVRRSFDLCRTIGWANFRPTAEPHDIQELEYEVVSGSVERRYDERLPSMPHKYGDAFEVIELVVAQRTYSDSGQVPEEGFWIHVYEFVPKGHIWHLWTRYMAGDDSFPFWEPPACEAAPEGIRELCTANIGLPYNGPFIDP